MLSAAAIVAQISLAYLWGLDYVPEAGTRVRAARCPSGPGPSLPTRPDSEIKEYDVEVAKAVVQVRALLKDHQ